MERDFASGFHDLDHLRVANDNLKGQFCSSCLQRDHVIAFFDTSLRTLPARFLVFRQGEVARKRSRANAQHGAWHPARYDLGGVAANIDTAPVRMYCSSAYRGSIGQQAPFLRTIRAKLA